MAKPIQEESPYIPTGGRNPNIQEWQNRRAPHNTTQRKPYLPIDRSILPIRLTAATSPISPTCRLAAFALPGVFCLARRDGLPLHIAGVVRAAAGQRLDVIDDIAGARAAGFAIGRTRMEGFKPVFLALASGDAAVSAAALAAEWGAGDGRRRRKRRLGFINRQHHPRRTGVGLIANPAILAHTFINSRQGVRRTRKQSGKQQQSFHGRAWCA